MKMKKESDVKMMKESDVKMMKESDVKMMKVNEKMMVKSYFVINEFLHFYECNFIPIYRG
jgi:hypothetical protein